MNVQPKLFKIVLTENDIKAIVNMYDVALKAGGLQALNAFNQVISNLKMQIEKLDVKEKDVKEETEKES